MRTCVARLRMIVRINLSKVIAILSACDMITRLTFCCYCINFIDINFRYICKWSERAKRDMLSSGSSYIHEKEIFKRCGVPVEKVSDNGPQFHSQEFEKFKEDNGVILLASSPHFAQNND